MARNEAANDRMRLRTYLRINGGVATVEDARNDCTRPGERLWSRARVRRAIEWDLENPDFRAQIKFERGGRGIRLVENDERVGVGQGAKAEVVRAIAASSKFVLATFGARGNLANRLSVIETGRRAGPEHGSNARPDIVVGSYVSKTSRRPLLHNIEFQGRNKRGKSTFTSSDIAQAFTSGRGADYSWVMIHKSARAYRRDKNFDQWDRATWFAERLGVGVILYSDPRVVSTWSLYLRARPRPNDPRFSKNYIAWFKRLLDEDVYPR